MSSRSKSVNLTHKGINGFKFRGGWDVHWDSKETGLGLRVYPSGRKAYVFSYRFAGKKNLMVLGEYGQSMTVNEARDAAGKQKRLLRDEKDPQEEKRRRAQGETFKDLATAYIEQHAKPNNKTWREDQRRLDRRIPAKWYSRKADRITRNDVGKLYSGIREKAPYAANRLLALLHHMFDWAHKRSPSYISREAIGEGWQNPAWGIERFKEKARKRYATEEEIKELTKAIDKEESIYVRSALWLLLLTGMRKMELFQAKRRDIDWNKGRLRLPDTKAGQEQAATLSAPAIAIMQAIPEVQGNPYLFPSTRQGKHLVNIENSWRRVRKSADCEDLRLHDLRRSVGSWMSQASVDLNRIKDALRHASISTTLTYARLGEDAAREAFEQHGKAILEAAGRKGPRAVVNGGKKE